MRGVAPAALDAVADLPAAGALHQRQDLRVDLAGAGVDAPLEVVVPLDERLAHLLELAPQGHQRVVGEEQALDAVVLHQPVDVLEDGVQRQRADRAAEGLVVAEGAAVAAAARHDQVGEGRAAQVGGRRVVVLGEVGQQVPGQAGLPRQVPLLGGHGRQLRLAGVVARHQPGDAPGILATLEAAQQRLQRGLALTGAAQVEAGAALQRLDGQRRHVGSAHDDRQVGAARLEVLGHGGGLGHAHGGGGEAHQVGVVGQDRVGAAAQAEAEGGTVDDDHLPAQLTGHGAQVQEGVRRQRVAGRGHGAVAILGGDRGHHEHRPSAIAAQRGQREAHGPGPPGGVGRGVVGRAAARAVRAGIRAGRPGHMQALCTMDGGTRRGRVSRSG